MYDLMGKDALVFRHAADSGQPADAPWMEQARNWSDHELRARRMTSPQDDRLGEIITATRRLFLDFDGSICSIFAGLKAQAIANTLRGLIISHGIILPADIEATTDPFDVFIHAASASPDLGAEVEAAMTDLSTAFAGVVSGYGSSKKFSSTRLGAAFTRRGSISPPRDTRVWAASGPRSSRTQQVGASWDIGGITSRSSSRVCCV